jgi:hypothetical protein
MSVTISKTDLARNTREIVDRVKQGQLIVVQSYGEEQIVLLDALDYHIMRALVGYAVHADQPGDTFDRVIHAYLDEEISLSKAAEELGLSRFDLMERFERLGIPLRIGPASINEAQAEVKAARRSKASDG